MGVLAGLAFRLKNEQGGRVSMVNLSPHTHGLLDTLGLNRLLDTAMIGETPPEFQAVLDADPKLEQLDQPDESKRESAETMLEAHENLVTLSPDNLPRFKDVLTFLREDVDKDDANPGPEPWYYDHDFDVRDTYLKGIKERLRGKERKQ